MSSESSNRYSPESRERAVRLVRRGGGGAGRDLLAQPVLHADETPLTIPDAHKAR